MTEKIEQLTLLLNGLHCAACVNRVEKSLKKVDGVISASVNLANQKAFVEFDKTKVTVDDLEKAVIDAGYEVIGSEDKKKLQT